MSFEDLDEALRSLSVHDVEPARLERTRARCVTGLARGAAKERHRLAPAVAEWLEPVAALGASVVYLVSAVKAATLLLTLGPRP